MSLLEAPIARPTAEEVRATLFEGLASVAVFAEAVDRSPRQVLFWITQGLPIVRIGRTPWVKIDAGRDWLRGREWKRGGTISSAESIAA